MTNIITISSTEVNTIKFAIDKIEEIRENINSVNQENLSKDDLVMSILDIEEVLSMVNRELETILAIH